MLTVFDPLCEGLRDPQGVAATPVLSWRLGSDQPGARQATCHVVVTSLSDGACVWDTGDVATDENCMRYAGRALQAGETCVWFVSVADEAGNPAYGVPASFTVGFANEVAQSPYGPQRLGCAWTSDDRLDQQLESSGDDMRLDGTFWHDVLGVRVDGTRVEVCPRLECGLSFAQGSMLLGRGLLIVRMECEGRIARLRVTIPPGMRGSLRLGKRRETVESGEHVIECPMA